MGYIQPASHFGNKVLLEHHYTHLLTCFLWLHLHEAVELSGYEKYSMAIAKPRIFTILLFTEKPVDPSFRLS